MSTSPPQVFDTDRHAQNLLNARSRQALPGFLEKLAFEELADRLASIKRKFLSPALISTDPASLLSHIAPSLEPGAGTVQVQLGCDSLQSLETLALETQAHDCILISCGLEWVNDLPGALARLRHSLKPDGVLIAAMLGGDTLHELRAAWLTGEASLRSGASPRVAPFCDVRDAGALLQRAGFTLPVVDTDRLTVRYDGALALMRELKEFGLSNALSERSRALLTPQLLAAVCNAYDTQNRDDDGRVRATFQMLYLTGWAEHDSQQKPLKPGSAQISLTQVLRSKTPNPEDE